MTEQEISKMRIEKLEQELSELRDIVRKFVGIEKYIFSVHSQILEGRNIQLGKTIGTKFGTETTQKIGFLNATPVSRQSSITSPSGGATVDSQARTAIDSLITTLEQFGFVAPN